MDERHWWFATKLQETFHIGPYDTPTMLEDFMAEQTTLEFINDFLAPSGHTKLFFYCPKPDANSLAPRKMQVVNSCAKLKEVMDGEAICLYFIRSDVNRVIDPTCVEKEVFCGEIKHNPLVHFSSLLSNIFGPILHSQANWGSCMDEDVSSFLTQFDKYTNTLSEYASATVAPQQLLKRPEVQITTDFKQNRAAAVNPIVLQEYENLVMDWISTIENVLLEGMEQEKSDSFAGPLMELEKWKKRQKVLTSITDQLKGKECKAVIAVLITAKCKVLKRWKATDASITDAFNETKDKVKYLEALKKYFDQLSGVATVSSICSTTLPGLMASVRQMDSISRYYARTGFLGILFSKVTNQIVLAAKKYIKMSTCFGDEDRLWTCVQEEVNSGAALSMKIMRGRKKLTTVVGSQEDSFLYRLGACISLHKQYRDMLRSLRDGLGGSHGLSQISSAMTPSTIVSAKRSTVAGSTSNLTSGASPVRISTSNQGKVLRGLDHASVTSEPPSGLAMTDEESIVGHLETFCTHVRNMMDIVHTLAQFSKLANDVKNLPRVPMEVVINGPPDKDEQSQADDGHLASTQLHVNKSESVTSESDRSRISDDSATGGSTVKQEEGLGSILESLEDVEEVKDIYTVDVAPSLSVFLTDCVDSMKRQLTQEVTTDIFLDVEGKDREKFEDSYTSFVTSVHRLENNICNYIKGSFTLNFNIKKALAILTSFNVVLNRTGLKAVLSEKFLEVFGWFEDELEDVQKVYENEKESPPLVRNAPLVAGAITWSRNLMKRIEDPMKIFKENKFVTTYRDFGRIVKFYNRIATALVKFESLWLGLWKSRIDSSLGGLKTSLLAQDPETRQLVVNADGRILELIHESRALIRLGITIPDTATEVLKQENRFKHYKQSLELVLDNYYSVCEDVPPPLRKLLTPHMESVLHYLQPGLSTLAWNSMNIDAYLHQVHAATLRLRDIVNCINAVVKNSIEKKIEEIKKMLLFDTRLALSKIWGVEKFIEDQRKSIEAQGRKLHEVIKEVENALQEIIAIANQRQVTSPSSPQVSRNPSASFNPGGDHLAGNQRLTKIGTVMPTVRQSRSNTAVSGLTDESVIGDIFGHYCSIVYKAVLNSIVLSLNLFGDCVKQLGRVQVGMASTLQTSVIPEDEEWDSDSTLSDYTASLSYEEPSWSTENTLDLLRFDVKISFNIPDIIVSPTMRSIQEGINTVAKTVIGVSKAIMWWAADVNESFHKSVSKDELVLKILNELSVAATSLEGTVTRQLFNFHRYDFLWRDDMHSLYQAFVESDPGTAAFQREIEKLQKIEEKVCSIPERLNIGCICLNTAPIKDSLHGLAVAWKTRYSTQLHEEAKIELDKIVSHRNSMYERLSCPVVSLDELNSAFGLLQELSDMENSIDDLYLPVENIYAKLRDYNLWLRRTEVEEVDNLRDEWVKLMTLAEKVRTELLFEKRGIFEQELDREVKAFVVNVIQFRNSFDSQGPAVPGVRPAEAVGRLQDFQQRYTQYEAQRKTLDAVQILFGIPLTPYAELDKTGEELELLGLMYGLFQQFIFTDQNFRDTLWSEVDLVIAHQEMEHYWQECLRLPLRIQEWDAYKEMKDAISSYLGVFPILHKLNSKEIRNRHWLQVMSVTGSSFQLEAHIFKLARLLDIDLIKHQSEIEEICRNASRELELEAKMRSIEEEWTEQVLAFDNFKNRGLVCLSHSNTEHLLDLLEDAQATLAVMLTSRHIGPLRDEAAAWAIKLREIGEVLDQWISVQDLWLHLEEVFSHGATAKELPQEFNRFARVDKGYMKMMKRAYETKNVLQCCVGGDVPKIQMLKHLFEELEICFKSLIGFLDNKRKVFPRFCFVTDPVLLAILSQPYSLESVKPYLRCLFTSVHDITLIQQEGESIQKSSIFSISRMKASRDDASAEEPSTSKFKRISEMIVSSGGGVRRSSMSQQSVEVRAGEGEWNQQSLNVAIEVQCKVGETIELKTQIPLTAGVEQWLSALLRSIQESLHCNIVDCIQEIESSQSIEEWAVKYPAQVCRLGLLYIWTKECEAGINDIRIDRKAMPNAARRFWSSLSKLPHLLARGSWKHVDTPMTNYHKARLENILSAGMYLRDVLDELGRRKLREVTDFEWRRNIRFYGLGHSKGRGEVFTTEGTGEATPETEGQGEEIIVQMLDTQLSYGCEFYGGEVSVAMTPVTERCFLSLTQAIWNFYGGCISGPTGVGKTETIKGLAALLGRYLLTLSCSPSMASTGMAKIICGMAEEGCWGLMDDFHRVNREVLSVMVHQIQAVMMAMRASQGTCHVDEGKEIAVHPNFSAFLTVRPTEGASCQLQPEVKALFRPVAMVMPDMSLILRSHCAGQGFKAPKVLADKLKLAADISKEQLSGKVHHTFSLASLVGVIQHAGQKRAAHGPNRLSTGDAGRPTSSQSVATQIGRKLHRTTQEMALVCRGIGSMKTDRGSHFSQNKDKKPGTPSALSSAAKLEHALILQSLQECIGPRLTQEELGIFSAVLRDVFYGLPKPGPLPYHVTKVEQDFENLLMQYTREKGLVPHPTWIAKVHQLRNLAKVHHGIIVAGSPGTGKTSSITILIDTLTESSNIKHRNTGSQIHTHKLQCINPLAVSDPSLMFGRLNSSGDFEDGIFTACWRKANKDHSMHKMTTWICLDAPLHAGWTENLNSVLDKGKYLNIINGERLYLSENVKLLFETDDISKASPATVSRTGIVFMDETVLGWRPLAEAWLRNRSSQEVHCLQRAFNKTLDAITQFVLYEAKPLTRVCEVGLFSTCLAMLKALIEGNTDISDDLHIERLYLFSLIWAFGCILEEMDRKRFSDLLLSLTTALPDYDQEISVFDYYVDESGEWDMWQSKVPDVSYFDAADLLGEVFVDTLDTVRTRLFIELASASGRNILLTGATGSGKTTLINDFLDKQEDKHHVVKRYVFSGTSTADELQNFIESNIHHRQGFVYGAKKGKILNVFIDDLNLPRTDKYGVQEANELLRQILDEKLLFNTNKPFDRRVLEGFVVTSAMKLRMEPSSVGQERVIPERLKRHFAVFNLPTPTAESLFTIVTSVLEGNMAQNQGMGLPQDFHEQIVKASCAVLNSVQDVLKPSPTPGRCHYQFNLRAITRVFQGLKNCSEEMRADEEHMVSLWQHEVTREIKDRLCRSTDIKWFEKTLKAILKEHFPTLPANTPSPLFVTFPLDPVYASRPTTQARTSSKPQITLQAISDISEVSSCIEGYLRRYNDEFCESLELLVSGHVLYHVVRIHRLLSAKNRGNALLVGAIGTHLSALARLALYMLEYSVHPVDCSYANTFLDGVRSAVRQAGCDGKTTTLLFDATNLHEDMYLEALNSLLISGEYPPLFSEDETESLLQALMPAIKKKFSSFLADPMKFFITRVKANLHVVLCLPPTHHLLRTGASRYPGILFGCSMNFIKDWPQYALEGEATYYLEKHKILQGIPSHISEKVVPTLSTIHGHVLRECHQIPWSGDDRVLSVPQSPPPSEAEKMPLSRVILHERINLKHQSTDGTALGDVFVGPTTYIRFMHCFRHVFSDKRKEAARRVEKLRLAIETLEQTRKDAVVIKETISKTKEKLVTATSKSDRLLQSLTAKATILEKLKAKLGIGSSTLSAFVALIDNEIVEDDSSLLDEEEVDELDEEFERMKNSKLTHKKLQIMEEIVLAERSLTDATTALKKAEEQVNLWMNKVDRSCCERLKAFQQPPPMVGMVMVMVMVLLGRPEFVPGIGGVGSAQGSSRYEKKGDPASSLTGTGTSFSDEASRSSSATPKKQQRSTKGTAQAHVYGVSGDGRIDRPTWKTIQQIMNDSQKIVESLHGIPWRQGLSDDIMKGVQSFFATNSEGEIGVSDHDLRLAAAGTSASTYDSPGGGRTPADRQKPQGITIAASKYSSEDAAVLVEYTISLVEYTKAYKPYRKAQDYLDTLLREKEEAEHRAHEEDEQAHESEEEKDASAPEKELTESDLPALQEEVSSLQKQYEEAVMIKYNLDNEVKSCSERLKAANNLLTSIKQMERSWKAYVEEYNSPEILLSNCIAASAFLTYCGPMGIDSRRRMGKFFMNVCKEKGLPLQKSRLFSRLTLAEFLKGKLTLKKWESYGHLTHPIALDNACIASQEESSNAWTLLCDPQRTALTWLTTMLGQPVVVKYKELRGHLETCLMEGTILLLTDVEPSEFGVDQRFYHIIRSRYRFLVSQTPFKLTVGENEIECQPGFRLILATTCAASGVPSGLAAYINVVEFCQSRDGMEEMFLDRFMRLEKLRMQEARSQVIQEMVTLMDGLQEAEENILQCLGSGHRLLYDLAATKRLTSVKRLHEETEESQTRARGIENSILQSREGYRPIARRAAVMFDTARVMAEINALYQTSLTQFLLVFDAAIKHSERTAVKAVVERLGQSAFYSTARGLFEKDRAIFAVLTALEVEDSAGRIGPGDREFIVHPAYGAAIKTALNPGILSDTASRTQTKKPFDWMGDEQFANLQLLAQNFEWFQDPFDKLVKDGRETQWRQLTEHDVPEMVTLPENLDEKYTPVQRFMVLRALRGDRLMQEAMCFVTSVLGKRCTGDIPLDLAFAYRQSDSRTPLLFLYTGEASMVEKLVIDAAHKKQVEIDTVSLSSVGSSEERYARKLIHKAMTQGHWVLLHNAHNAPRLLSALDSFVHETKTIDSEFRLWVSVQPHANIPSSIIQSAVKIVADSPKFTKDSLQRSMAWVDADLLRVSSRVEWPALLHNICMLHSVVRLRSRYKLSGFNRPQDVAGIGTAELWQALDLAVREFQDNAEAAQGGVTKSIQWGGLRYMFSEVVYGSCVSDEFDRQAVSAMIDYWISPAAVKREFEASKIKYKLPSALFGSHVRLNTLMQSLEGLSGDLLELPEACGLHSSSETYLASDQYVFSRLNLLLDRMSSSDSLTHAVSDPSSLMPTSGVIVTSATAQPIGSGAITVSEAGVFASASLVNFRGRREVELNEVCSSMMGKIPKLWNRDVVHERMKKAGGATPFNMFILSEVDCMFRLIAAVRETLTKKTKIGDFLLNHTKIICELVAKSIKAATDEGVMGDHVTNDILQAADDIYHLRIPARWCTLGGEASPPSNWTLTAWFADLHNRFAHIDKIILLGRDRMPAYWLAAFFNPRRLLAIIKQEAVRNCDGKASATEPFVFQTEITGRDKDHLREPPLEGMFVYGIYLWGCAWEKTTGDLLDAPPRSGPTPLPVVHIVAMPQSEKATNSDPLKVAVSYSCPCFSSRISTREPVILLDIDNKDIPASRWPLRGLSSTLRPF